MRTSCHQQAGGFYTPPPTKNYRPVQSSSSPLPPSQPELRACQTDNVHIRHKLPAGDSPYVRAKHVQLVDKNPGKAVSLFWAAINSGDRVDSALKDMAVVMKQLDRSDEAIEAIKSFRSLCLPESQDSLDNVLVELYKRSGRIEEEIEILHHKLKRIEEGVTFGGKRWKIARCQGRRVQVTIEQETARILGNLAWAYLQLGKYTIAEEKYREGLLLDPDKNMQCNLAYCLLQTGRVEEAKSLLRAVKSSSEDEFMDESYAKSYERAFSMLSDLEQEKCQSKGSVSALPSNCAYPRTQWKYGWSFGRRMNSDNTGHENGCFNDANAKNVLSGFQNTCGYQLIATASPILLTQPRSPWRSSNNGQRKKLWNGRVVGNSSRKLSFEQHNIDSGHAAQEYQICCEVSSSCIDGKKSSDWSKKAFEALQQSEIIRHNMVDDNQSGTAAVNSEQLMVTNGKPCLDLQNETKAQEVSHNACQLEAYKNSRKHSMCNQKPLSGPSEFPSYNKKSWADMVEEEELFAGLATLNMENVSSNFPCPGRCEMTQLTEDIAKSCIK